MSLYGGVTLPNKPDPENIRRLDLLAVPMVRKIERYGFRIDPEHFVALSSRLTGRMADLRADILNEIPAEALDRFLEVSGGETDDDDDPALDEGFNVESSAKIASLLYDTLGLDRTSGVKVKKTKGGARLSTGKKTLEQLKREHPVVPLILEYRENSKLESTYARAMPRRAKLHPRGPDCPVCGRFHWSDEWRIHTRILLTRTATGRTASRDPNLGNIPARTDLGREIRAGFIASEGYVIAQRDWAQIELRLLADQSGDPTMIGVYERDGDIHLFTAMETFNITDPTLVDKLLHRAPSKNTNFAVVYLITGAGLLDLMATTFAVAKRPMPEYMTEKWCDDYILRWFGVYTKVKPYLENQESLALRYGINWTPMGRVRRIPEVYSYHPHIRSAGIRQGCNHGIQGFSADLMRLAMGEVEERLNLLAEYDIPSYPLMTIYDELLVETPEDHGDTIEALLGEIMDNVLVDRNSGKSLCRVPIRSDGKIMERWLKE